MIRFPVAPRRKARGPELVVLAARAQAASATTTSLRVRVSNTGLLTCRPTLFERGHASIRARLSVSHQYLLQHGPIASPELAVELTMDLAPGDVLTLCSRGTLPHSLDTVLAMGGAWLVVVDRVDPARAGVGPAAKAIPSKSRFVFFNA